MVQSSPTQAAITHALDSYDAACTDKGRGGKFNIPKTVVTLYATDEKTKQANLDIVL